MSQATPTKRKYILIVSDKPTIRDVLDRLFKLDGYFVLTAADCEEGLGKARLQPVNLIVLDMDMKGSIGDAVRTKFKHETATAHLPVILLGTRFSTQDLLNIAAGTDSFFPMPFSLSEVREMVNHLLAAAGQS